MPATDTNTLLGEAKCYECYGNSTIGELLILAQLRNQLLALNPTADVTPDGLLAYAKCYACYGLSFSDLFEIAMLDQIAQLS